MEETKSTVKLELPTSLVLEAQKEGLLTEEVLEKTLREELRRRRVGDLMALADRLAKVDLPPVPDDEVVAIVREVRRERRARNATRS